MTQMSLDDRKSIIVLCDLCPKIHVIYVFPIIRTYLLMLEHSDKNVIYPVVKGGGFIKRFGLPKQLPFKTGYITSQD